MPRRRDPVDGTGIRLVPGVPVQRIEHGASDSDYIQYIPMHGSSEQMFRSSSRPHPPGQVFRRFVFDVASPRGFSSARAQIAAKKIQRFVRDKANEQTRRSIKNVDRFIEAGNLSPAMRGPLLLSAGVTPGQLRSLDSEDLVGLAGMGLQRRTKRRKRPRRKARR